MKVSKMAEARRRRGLTQDELAQRLELASKGSLSAIETGAEAPSLELAMRIEVELDGEVSAAELRPDLAARITAWLSVAARAPKGAAA